jgi:glucoamylase
MPQKTFKSPAPGAPGIPGKWTSSSKSGIGKSLSSYSQVSFTTSHGILNEVYYPREDNACIRDMELLITKDGDFFAEEKRDTRHESEMVETGIPCYKITNTGLDTLYKIFKEIITDPLHNTVLQKIKFEPITGKKEDFQLYALLAPHISNQSAENIGWLDEYKGVPMLFAERDGITLALACSLPWKKRSVGFVGVSDGYTDISTHKSMQWEYDGADSGNLALTGEIDISSEDEFTLALAFGRDMNEAAQHAHASLLKGFDGCKQLYVKQWSDWHQSIDERKSKDIKSGKLFRNSVAIMRMHESFHFSGAVIASLSIPWGNTKGDGDIGGYHVVWPRDLVECSSGFLAFNAQEDALRVMNYLMATQEADGHWPQNMWLEGKPYWDGLQLDQIAFPILLIGRYKKDNGLTEHESKVAWKTVRRAAGFLLRYGPLSPQERWEEESGISVSTIATCIAALLVAAEMADEFKDSRLGKYCREEADYWNSQIENWLYVKHTPMASEEGVEGYYIRINPTGCLAKDLDGQIIGLKNRPDDEKNVPVNELVSVDALALVRFGLRSAKDPKILNTIKVIDSKLKVETPHGPCWHRYNNDGYGEHEDGSAFDGTGIGRAWPLLTGERAHYEVAAGNVKGAQALMKTMEGFASHELFPEQIWDTNDIVAKNLYLGSHSGSAIPLVWAHAEYVKLCASVSQKKVFDMPDHTIERYIKNKNESKFDIWRFMLPCPFIKKGNTLRIITEVSATVSWSVDNWEHVQQKDAIDGGFGIHYIDVPVDAFDRESVVFTFYWTDAQHWENKNYEIKIIK